MVTGLVEPTGEMSGQWLLVAASGVFIELTAGDGQTGSAHWQSLRTSCKLCMVWWRQGHGIFQK